MEPLSPEERHHHVAAIAQRLYEDEGRPEGLAEVHWRRAEAFFDGEEEGYDEPSSPPSAESDHVAHE